MTGRELCKRYAQPISCLGKLVAILPSNYRKHMLEKGRNRTGKLAMLKRYLLVKSLAKQCGTNVAIFPGVYFENIENLEIGNNVSIHQMCYIDAEGGIVIGNEVSIGHRSTLLSSNHLYDDLDIPIKYQGMDLKKTIIMDNVWIGCGCAILAGVVVNSGSIVGANSTVTKNVPEKTIVAGSPAKYIKSRN